MNRKRQTADTDAYLCGIGCIRSPETKEMERLAEVWNARLPTTITDSE